MSEPRLDQFDQDEWFDLCRSLRPGITREQFEEVWERFEVEKLQHLRERSQN